MSATGSAVRLCGRGWRRTRTPDHSLILPSLPTVHSLSLLFPQHMAIETNNFTFFNLCFDTLNRILMLYHVGNIGFFISSYMIES